VRNIACRFVYFSLPTVISLRVSCTTWPHECSAAPRPQCAREHLECLLQLFELILILKLVSLHNLRGCMSDENGERRQRNATSSSLDLVSPLATSCFRAATFSAIA
jgi:hypothetical protein